MKYESVTTMTHRLLVSFYYVICSIPFPLILFLVLLKFYLFKLIFLGIPKIEEKTAEE